MRYAKTDPQASLAGMSVTNGLGTYEGDIAKIRWQAADTGKAIVVLDLGRGEELATIGVFAGQLREGARYRCTGIVSNDPKWGRQLKADTVTPIVPESATGVAVYLESFDGIGPMLAKRLIAAFGAATVIDALERTPADVAAKVAGLSVERAQEIAAALRSHRDEREAFVFLHGIGLSTAMAKRVYGCYGARTIGVVQENPYRMARDVDGIGFVKVDPWALNMGIKPDAQIRREAALLYVLGEATDEGHCYLPREQLFDGARNLVGSVDLAAALDEMKRQKQVVLDGDAVYLARLHRAEVEIADQVRLLQRHRRPPPAIPTGGALASQLAQLSDEQGAAIRATLTAAVTVITGPPGSGKSTAMKAAVTLWREAGKTVLLCAPTGRAAKRLAEATGREAKTIHRLIEWIPGAGPGRTSSNPLMCDLVICDEHSMADVSIMRNLLDAIPPGASLLCVGDVDQLPSVGPGQVLYDMIESGAVPVSRLTRIYRQAAGSEISEQARRINAGMAPESGGELEIVEVADGMEAQREVVRLVCVDLPNRLSVKPSDIQVITPMRENRASSAMEINRVLQEALNPSGASINRGKAPPLRLGDPVMQRKNSYDRTIFNGDIGEIVEVDVRARALKVRFDGVDVDCKGEQVGELELARACTVHKFQGAESPVVVVCCLMEHFALLKRNLLYTAATRGKRHVVLVAQTKALWLAAKTPDTSVRFTRLVDRLRGEPEPAPRVEPLPVDPVDDDPMPDWMDAPRPQLVEVPLVPQIVAPVSSVLPTHREAAHRAMQILAGMCDGAHSIDGNGFSKFDAQRGRAAAQSDYLDDTEARWAISKTRWYRKQLPPDVLDALGIDSTPNRKAPRP